jgi:hexosaminidase
MAENNTDVIIPQPQKIIPSSGKFHLNKNTTYFSNTAFSKNAENYLQSHLKTNAGYRLEKVSTNNHILFQYDKNKIKKAEGYQLHIGINNIRIIAKDSAGFFYATITLMQLMHTDIWRNGGNHKSMWVIPTCTIIDAPRYPWRGVMLDTSRNFFSKAYIKKFLDRMAQHKLNRFHWHLTDDEGWRIEIKKYPLLTQVGAKRGPGTKLPFSIFPAMRGAKNRVQSGYYTQADIREVVSYAKDRSIEILPEIDIPGHSKAAVIAYPTLLQDPQDTSIYRSVQKIRNNTINPAMESSYVFLENVLSEVSSLFPFAYIHLGGDEVPRGAWEKSPAVKQLMKNKNLKSTRNVENYFFTRMDKILKKYNKKMIAWQEVLQGKPLLRKENIFMAWKNTKSGYRAMKKHRNIIMSPVQYLYFDQQYIRSNNEPGHTWSTPVSTQKAYSFKPQKSRYLKGLHACLWSETMLNEKIADYLAWPRIFALSEIAWTGEKNHHWKTFQKRASGIGLKRLKVQGVHYRAIVPIE